MVLGGGGRAIPHNFKELLTKTFIAAQSCKTWGLVIESRSLISKNANRPPFWGCKEKGVGDICRCLGMHKGNWMIIILL